MDYVLTHVWLGVVVGYTCKWVDGRGCKSVDGRGCKSMYGQGCKSVDGRGPGGHGWVVNGEASRASRQPCSKLPN